MDTSFNPELIVGYKSKSQIARVLTETWTAQHMYCPTCGFPTIAKFPNNRAVATKRLFLIGLIKLKRLRQMTLLRGVDLEMQHPNNNNIRAKIRQQLQQLRDRSIISFLGKGYYKKNPYEV